MKTEQLYLRLADAIRNAETNPPCQETDPDAWFSEKADIGYSREAKALCQACPVIEQCATYAIEAREQFGIWGGLSPRERQAVRGKGRGRPKTT